MKFLNVEFRNEKTESGKAAIEAEVSFDKKYNSRIDEVDDYIALQLDFISKDGVFAAAIMPSFSSWLFLV